MIEAPARPLDATPKPKLGNTPMLTYSLDLPDASGAEAFCLTPSARDIINVIDISRAINALGAIVAAPGTGKTATLTHYSAENPDAIYCVMNPSTRRSAGSALRSVCQALGAVAAGSHDGMLETIRYDFERRGDTVLLIDEAQFLGDEALDMLRCIYDESGTPIVFAGNRWLRDRVDASFDSSFAQFSSRVGPKLEIEKTTPADVDALAEWGGVTDAKAKAWLRKRCAGVGGLRVAGRLMKAARVEAGEGKVRLIHLQQAVELMGGRA